MSTNTEHPVETNPFASLGLSPALLQALTDAKYETPTPIQVQTIPLLLQGKDVVGQAQTGTGKTAAFSLPLLQKLDVANHAVQALVLTPTRELAIQVTTAIHTYAKHIRPCSVLTLYGGDSMQRQFGRLKQGVHVVVATPGRLMDHMRRGSIQLDQLKMLVLDEADEMLRMGFLEDVTWILEQLPAERQVALFSATMPAEIKAIAKKHLKDPAQVHVKNTTVTNARIDQRYIPVNEHHKWDVLTRLMDFETLDATLIFTRTKASAAVIADKLEARGQSVEALHSDLSQAQRQSVLQRLRDKRLDVVVATDVAARGLDIHHISHVINYDMPGDAETYVHRIGRTGRVSQSGTAILFVTPRERNTLRQIESYTKQTIQRMDIPSLADLAVQRGERLKNKVLASVTQEGLDPYLDLVTTWSREANLDIRTLAAAALRLVQGSEAFPDANARDPLLASLAAQEEREKRESKKPTRSFGPPSRSPRAAYPRRPREGGEAPPWGRPARTAEATGDAPRWSKPRYSRDSAGPDARGPRPPRTTESSGEKPAWSRPARSEASTGGESRWPRPARSAESGDAKPPWSRPTRSTESTASDSRWAKPSRPRESAGTDSTWSRPARTTESADKGARGFSPWKKPARSGESTTRKPYAPRRDR